MSSILLNNDTTNIVPHLKDFELWIDTIIKKHGSFFQVSIEIVNYATSQNLNKTYRNIDKPTNVLSFPLELPEFVQEDLIGDLAICAAIVEEEAKAQKKPLNDHWAHLTIHGVLHLLGYDHIDDSDAQIMEDLEIKLLAKLDIANPYD